MNKNEKKLFEYIDETIGFLDLSSESEKLKDYTLLHTGVLWDYLIEVTEELETKGKVCYHCLFLNIDGSCDEMDQYLEILNPELKMDAVYIEAVKENLKKLKGMVSDLKSTFPACSE